MSKIKDFIKKCKLPIMWTIGYIFVIWAVLHLLFGFEIFSESNWIRISHAHLRGLSGLTFSLIILAAIPLYIATLSIVIRTQKPLLALPVPKFVAKIIEKIFPKKTEPTQTPEPESPDEHPTNDELDKIPAEMRGAFIRARSHPNRINTPICSACSVTPNIYPNNDKIPAQPINNDLPLPPDFDFDDVVDTPLPSAPVFQDINFYDDDTENTTNENNKEISDNPVIEYLNKSNREFNVLDNGIILTENTAIAIHTDSDFWIMDDPIWFASGKTRESPIGILRDTATEHNVQAVLYLGATNIMNLDTKRQEWESAGIHIVTELSDL